MKTHKPLTFAEYLEIDAVNWSTLKEMRRSALHYRYGVEVPREDTVRFALGRGAHTAILEPDRFPLDYAVFDGERRAGKAWDAFKEAHASRTILKAEEYAKCLAMRDAVRRHPVAAPYLERGRAEVSLTWTDPATGLPCKGRLDWESISKRAIVDIKTTSTVDARRFGALAARMGYHCQLAFYADGWAAALGDTPPVVIIAVEADPPHDVGVFVVDADALYAGSEECAELLAKVAACRRTGQWHGRYTEEQVLRLPAWVFADDEDDDATGLDISVSGHGEKRSA